MKTNFTFYKIYLLTAFVGCLFATNAQAQNHDGLYGNEWINYNQTYLKLKVAEDGFYRISNTVPFSVCGYPFLFK